MTKLTTTTILSRAKGSRTLGSGDLKSIKRINLWGLDLHDISILTTLPSLQILSLSVNCIDSLEPIAHLKDLQELFLRKNHISDFNEIHHLQSLPRLSVLWLEENPICRARDYRSIVLSILPRLTRLDNIDVTPQEVAIACQFIPPDLAPPSHQPLHQEKQEEYKNSEWVSKESLGSRSKLPPLTTTSSVRSIDSDHFPIQYPVSNGTSQVNLDKVQWVADQSPTDPIAIKEQIRAATLYEGSPVSLTSPLPAESLLISPMKADARFEQPIQESRNNNVLMAVLALLQELDPMSLRLVRDTISKKLNS